MTRIPRVASAIQILQSLIKTFMQSDYRLKAEVCYGLALKTAWRLHRTSTTREPPNVDSQINKDFKSNEEVE